MIVALSLAGYAALVGGLGARLLRLGGWGSRSPRIAIAAWQAAMFSVAFALVLAGISLAVPAAAMAGGLAGLLRSCAMAIRDAYATPGGAAAVGSGLVLSVAVSARVCWCTAGSLLQATRVRRRHHQALSLLGHADPALGVTVVDCAEAAAYCLPGRDARVVISTGALNALSHAELAAVLAHERAHLAGRHHLVLAGVDGLRRAFPRIPLFAAAADEVGALVEMLADDAAGRSEARPVVAAALIRLAGMNAPQAALAAGGSHAVRRVRRLLSPARPLRGIARTAIAAAIMLALGGPVAAAAAPAASVAGMRYCPITQAHSR